MLETATTPESTTQGDLQSHDNELNAQQVIDNVEEGLRAPQDPSDTASRPPLSDAQRARMDEIGMNESAFDNLGMDRFGRQVTPDMIMPLPPQEDSEAPQSGITGESTDITPVAGLESTDSVEQQPESEATGSEEYTMVPVLSHEQIVQLGETAEGWSDDALQQMAEHRAEGHGRSVEPRDIRWAKSVRERVLKAHDEYLDSRDTEAVLNGMDRSNTDVRQLVKKEHARVERYQDNLSKLVDELNEMGYQTVGIGEGPMETPVATPEFGPMRDAYIKAVVEKKLEEAKTKREAYNAIRRERYAQKRNEASARLNAEMSAVLGDDAEEITPVSAGEDTEERPEDVLRKSIETMFDQLVEVNARSIDELEQKTMGRLGQEHEDTNAILNAIVERHNATVAESIDTASGDSEAMKAIHKGLSRRDRIKKKLFRTAVGLGLVGMTTVGILSQPDAQPVVNPADASTTTPDIGIVTPSMTEGQQAVGLNNESVVVTPPEAPEDSSTEQTVVIPDNGGIDQGASQAPVIEPEQHIVGGGEEQTVLEQPQVEPTTEGEQSQSQQEILEQQVQSAYDHFMTEGQTLGVGGDDTWKSIDDQMKNILVGDKNWVNPENGYTLSNVMADIGRHLVEKNQGKSWGEIYAQQSDEAKQLLAEVFKTTSADQYITQYQDKVTQILLNN